MRPLLRDQAIRHVTAGAGGYGDPLLRDPARVLDDVRNGKVSVQAAERDYGVMLRPGDRFPGPAIVEVRESTARPRPRAEHHAVESIHRWRTGAVRHGGAAGSRRRRTGSGPAAPVDEGAKKPDSARPRAGERIATPRRADFERIGDGLRSQMFRQPVTWAN